MATRTPKQKPHRYNSAAIIMHWAMALGFFLMLGSGVAMSYFDLDQSLKFQMYQWHKGGGVLLLLAFGLRISWRIISEFALKQVPALPEKFSKLEKIAAHLGHLGLYGLMLALPLSGWVMVSASVYGLPTIVFNMFEWPHIPGIQGHEQVESLAKLAHFYLAIGFGLMICAHIGAVVKHALKDKVNLMPRMWWSKAALILLLAGFISMGATAQASDYDIDYSQSTISFSGTHAGNVFEGQFENWQAQIHFDPENLESSKLIAVFNPASAKTGNKMYDGTLPQTDWFNAKQFPEARFASKAITRNNDATYKAQGELEIRGIKQSISFNFTLSDLQSQPVFTKGEFEIDRLAFDIGKKSDPGAAWVSREILVTINITANAKE